MTSCFSIVGFFTIVTSRLCWTPSPQCIQNGKDFEKLHLSHRFLTRPPESLFRPTTAVFGGNFGLLLCRNFCQKTTFLCGKFWPKSTFLCVNFWQKMPFYAVIWPFILWCNQTIFWVHFTVGGDNQNELIKARFNFVIFKFYRGGVNSTTDMPTWIIFLKISNVFKILN